ncbi:MAG TPA: MaoC/PaaZ C-terminal domain-containing protein, partial [Myxococcaceae bacterium]|nr:MaoC/PaaZ C-terminal domain-containing protein [Myxococcaceae bacterium]
MTEGGNRGLAYEDLVPARRWTLPPRSIRREDIIRFAREWDPQPFHLDEEAARKTHFGGLVASGWHTACLAMRIAVDGLLEGSTSLGSPGLEEL